MTDEVIEITPSGLFKLTKWRYGQRVRVKCRIIGFTKPKDFPYEVKIVCPEGSKAASEKCMNIKTLR